MAGRLSWRRDQKGFLALLDATDSAVFCFMIYDEISPHKPQVLSKSHYRCQTCVSTAFRNWWSTVSEFWDGDDQMGLRKHEEVVRRWLEVMEENSEAGQRCQPAECNHRQKFSEIWDRKQNFLQSIWYQCWIVKEKAPWKNRGFRDFWVTLPQTWISMVICFSNFT